jgi:adenosylcobinamide-phosphate synthase
VALMLGGADQQIATVALAVAADALLGEPPARCHPVVAMGCAIAAAEHRAPTDPRLALAYGGIIAIGGAFGCWLAARLTLPALRGLALPAALLAEAVALKSTFAVRALDDAAVAVADALAAGDLDAARFELRALVSRDTVALGTPLLAAAAIESLAENLSDSFVAPVFWYAVLGVPGALAYRYVNTCDAMLGYHGHYEYLGKLAARLDDAANWLPARLTALLLVAAARLSGADAGAAWRVMWRFHGRTESPNAGWPMSAAAGALGVRLEKRGAYALGDGRPPTAITILRATVLVRVAAALATFCYVIGMLAWGQRAAAA